MPLSAAAELTGLDQGTIYSRIKAGWPAWFLFAPVGRGFRRRGQNK